MRAVITVTGKDRTGIIAKISNTLYEQQVNIIDISQNVMEDVFANGHAGKHRQVHRRLQHAHRPA